MNGLAPKQVDRLQQLLLLVEREDHHLRAVAGRFFPEKSDELTLAWISSQLDTPEGVDRLESFGGKFARMQDTIVHKLLPTYLDALAEDIGAVIDNLNRAERLGLVESADSWIAMRRARNRLVHEYIDNPEVLLTELVQARGFVTQLHATYLNIKSGVERMLAPHD